MKKVIKFSVFVWIVFTLLNVQTAKSQQLPIYSQYMWNSFLLNPATAGSVSYIPIQLTVRQQWVGLKNSPKTYALSAHTLLDNNTMGVGGYIFNDKYGPISRTGMLAAYAYHLNLTKFDSKLSLGLSLSGFQFKFDERDLIITDRDDPLLSNNVETKFMPDASFGSYFYNERFYIGLSAAQLLQLKVNLGENTKQNKLVRHYYLLGGYYFKLSNDFDIEPSVLFKATKAVPVQLDINAKVTYKKNYWIGLSYRTSDALIVFLGAKFEGFFFGYAFDYPLSHINNHCAGSHEFMLGYHLAGSSKGSTLF
ncbi:MAG: type IX secretion system membrane protein PorP/SprF [Bacteroidia bacterium]|nr:type IX secretion system membrane protein PorP/SprF [Bacteroidia bacterium]